MSKQKSNARNNGPNLGPNKLFQRQANKPSGPVNGQAEQASAAATSQKRKFDNKNKKRKTFLGRCKRLLHNMVELDDSIPFRGPADKLKYPDYHMVVRYDIDLARIATKLMTGSYGDPHDFGSDVRLMVSNWTDYIKDHSLPVYSQITRLSWWFEAEFSKIINAYDEHKFKKRRVEVGGSSTSPSTLQRDSAPMQGVPTPPHLLSMVQENGRLRITRVPGQTDSSALTRKSNSQDTRTHPNQTRGKRPVLSGTEEPEEPNPAESQPVTSAQALTSSSWSSNSLRSDRVENVQRPSTEPTQRTARRKPTEPTTTASSEVSQNSMAQPEPPRRRPVTARSIPVNMRSRQLRMMAAKGAMATPATASRLTSATSGGAAASQPCNSPRGNVPPLRNATPPANVAVADGSRAASANSASMTSNIPSATPASPTTPATTLPELELLFSAAYVWYGEYKNKPPKEIKFTEHGLTFPLKDNNNEITFRVQASDIVRCCGHFGNIGKLKNTLFIFLSPAATKRLRTCVKQLSVTLEVCSLIVIFGQNLTIDKISRLIHIFWVMSRHSIYGQLFSEVSKMGALSILANIKPQIQQKLLVGAQNVRSNSSLHGTSVVSPSCTAGPRPNLSTARTRRNSSTEPPISSSMPTGQVASRIPAPENRCSNPQLNLPARPLNAAGFPHQRAHCWDSQEAHSANRRIPDFMGLNRDHWMSGPHPPPMQSYNGNGSNWGSSNNGHPRHPFNTEAAHFGAGQQRLGNLNYYQPNQQQYNQNPFEEGHSSGLLDDYMQDGEPQWLRPNNSNNSYLPQYNSFADLVSNRNPIDYTQDVNLDVVERQSPFGTEAFSPIHNRQTEVLRSNSAEPHNQEQPLETRLTEDPHCAHNTNVDSIVDAPSVRTVEVTPGGDRVVIRLSQTTNNTKEPQSNKDDHSESVPPQLTNSSVDYMENVEGSIPAILESNVSSTDQTMDGGETLEMPHLSRADLVGSADATTQEPVSSSEPVDLSCDVINSPETPHVEDNDTPSQPRSTTENQPTDFNPQPENEPANQNETIPLSDDDDDLEIIIPSDTEDELAFVPAKANKMEDGEDLVMMASRISTKCPVTQQVMRQPVKNKHCGHCYDRDGIQQLIINRTTKARCPVPGCSNPNALVMSDMELDCELFEHIRTHTTDPELQKALDDINERFEKSE